MNAKTTMGMEYIKELEMESESTRKCLARVSEDLFGYKPHEKSMKMGDLAMVVAEIPGWIKTIIEKSEIDFATYEQFKPQTAADLVERFEKNLEGAKNALQNMPDEELKKTFYLKNEGQELASSSKKESIVSSINHLVHHRGQLTVYMRLNNIPVPKIYGPSADEQGF